MTKIYLLPIPYSTSIRRTLSEEDISFGELTQGLKHLIMYEEKWGDKGCVGLKDSEELRDFFRKDPGGLDLFIKLTEMRIPTDDFKKNFNDKLIHLMELGLIGSHGDEEGEYKGMSASEIVAISSKEHDEYIARYKETLEFLRSVKEEISSV